MNILPLLDRPIAFQRSFIRLEMGVTAALFLSQLTYWTNRTTDDGWVYKTQDEWEEETGLSRYEQEGVRKKLRGLGVLLERKQGLPARLYYKIDNDVLCQLLTSAYKDAEKPHTGEGKTTRPVRGKPTNILTENTTENTTEIIDPPNPQGGDGDETILADAQKALASYNEQTNTRCRDVKPFVTLLTPTKTRTGYTVAEIELVIRWVLATWHRRSGSVPKIANICRVRRFDGYLADAEAWAVAEAAVDPSEVVNGYNEIFADLLPEAEIDTDRRRAIMKLLAHMRSQTLGAFLGYFEKFRDTAPEFYFGGEDRDGWRAGFDYLMKPETLRKTREGAL
ncbi:replication protein RepO [Escherichia marmotae]|uniref:replication protein RepO n=1 Tax=Escherichia marmotae TaxID=1499973 RepID=UPI0017686B89|nr:replication protein RepO [Escherichia marmotae]HAI8714124.1 replication protein RepO [Escherichia coli]MEC9626163.1 replication protein RepO [Escherichia marmotae]MED0363761.1 replication protein RepO [Escherichia marmotae]MED8777132.1 replication protein RepO [Escherichia marmotae]MED9200644.1 replication protein RepO [Escherichia marmotae]